MPRSSKLPPAVVAVMSYSGLAVARSLGRRGIKVYGLANSDNEVGMTSRYITPVVIPDLLSSEDNTVDHLVGLAKKLDEPAVIFPTGDAIILPLSRHRDTLRRYYRFTIPDHDTAEKLISKAGLSEIIAERNIPGPRSETVNSPDDFQAAIQNISYPVLMKPIYSASWYLSKMVELIGVRKVIICDSVDELGRWYEKVSRVDPRVVLQELIPGDDDCLYYACGYFNSDGKLEAIFAGQKLRLTPIHFGSASFVKSVYDEKLFQVTTDLLAPLGYRGLFGVEFKKDPRDGIYKIIEVNVRWGLWDGMAARCGIDLAYLAYAREVGLPYSFDPIYREGINWLSSRRDIDAFIDYWREGSLSPLSWVRSLCSETEHAVYAVDDPQPAIAEIKAILREKVGSRLSRLLHQ